MLPDDFADVLARVQQSGILDEDLKEVDVRLTAAVETVGLKSGDLVSIRDVGEWIVRTRNNLLASVHESLCDKEKGCLKEDYKDLINLGLTPEGVTAVSGVVAGVISVINPAYAVSHVIIFIAIWLIRRGLNDWCNLPAK